MPRSRRAVISQLRGHPKRRKRSRKTITVSEIVYNSSGRKRSPAVSMTADATTLLLAWRRGDEAALGELVPIVYDELRRLAHRYLAGQRPGHTIQTTALVHEAYLRLIDCRDVRWQDRSHFLAVTACLMRRILVDYARTRNAHKRGDAIQ